MVSFRCACRSSRSRHSPAALAKPLPLVVWLLLPGCTGDAGPVPGELPARVERLPLTAALGPEDDIDALDAAVDEDGTLHVVWRQLERTVPGVLPEERTLYAFRTAGARWSPPEIVQPSGGDPPRLLLTAGQPEVVGGPRLHRWQRTSGGWRDSGPLLSAASAGIAFDVVATPEGPAFALLSRRGDDGFTLSFLGPARGATPVEIAAFPASVFRQPAPRLRVAGLRVDVVAGFTAERREFVTRRGRRAESVSSHARVVHLRSDDGGGSWQPPVEITAGREPPVVENVALLEDRRGLVALYSALGVFARRLDPAAGPARQLAAPELGALTGDARAWSISAAGRPERGAVAWIDRRFASSDRRPWNPLGGFPWSDDPDWINNDVWVLGYSEVEAALAGGAPQAERQTAAGSFAAVLKVASGPDGTHLLWAGRRQVGRNLDETASPPELFHLARP